MMTAVEGMYGGLSALADLLQVRISLTSMVFAQLLNGLKRSTILPIISSNEL